MEKAYIEVKNLKKIIKGDIILSDINLKLQRGKVYGFKGKNGSGKSMLFRAISGLIKATEGEIIIDGKKIGNDISFPENLGILIEHPGFLPDFTGFKNLKYLVEINKKIDDNKIKITLEAVGLDPEDKRKFKKYSLGMKQRLGVAQAVMENPDIIILDEPTNALDTDGVKLINKIILNLRNQNKLILISNHDKEEMEMIADEIYTIHEGKITDHVVLKKGAVENE
ncbi:ATP-binding cassette domain-containing protein [Clostridium sp.]|uniref:ATP-binding cassette domain-containing protein n=1 Tax=Clostridium sp. TaxID=1506 RepID=UPI00258276A3|nr:ATP-binding cassette domain-containing protein [Clostridium sp.]MDF2504705.1 bacitracin transport ATP-binding protein BcrA [Clostridium sp.]